MKLWQKNNNTMHTFIESFETKDDLVLDQKLIIYDVYGSIAHATMLKKIGIVTARELSLIMHGLKEIISLTQENNFLLQAGDEDIHTKIENFLTERYGEVGKKIHTGRSRNDQVLTMLRLYSKDKLLSIESDLLILIDKFLHFAKNYETIPMPGYTHMQKAMPSTLGMWGSSFVEAFIDNVRILQSVYDLSNQSPLGSAAGYGVPMPLDRKYTAELLGFAKIQINPIYCQNSRGKIESQIISALSSVLFDINKFASDVLFFTSNELDYFCVSDNLYSGSSIMPQKKNVDIAELLRSKIHILIGNYTQIMSLSSNLISGYNRDLQDSKNPFIESLDVTHESIKAATLLIENLKPKQQNLHTAMTPEIFATHQALSYVSEGMNFRTAYKTVGENLNQIDYVKIKNKLPKSTHIGGTENLELEYFSKTLQKFKKQISHKNNSFKKTLLRLISEKLEISFIDKKNDFIYNVQNQQITK